MAACIYSSFPRTFPMCLYLVSTLMTAAPQGALFECMTACMNMFLALLQSAQVFTYVFMLLTVCAHDSMYIYFLAPREGAPCA
eukprot:336847-Pelagomonas_calceolata.AAC.5